MSTNFATTNEVPVAVSEFGVMRWEPGAAEFMDDQMELFEKLGMNYALWMWFPDWEPFAENDAFDFQHGSDPVNHENVKSSDLLEIIVKYWKHSSLRPSSMAFM